MYYSTFKDFSLNIARRYNCQDICQKKKKKQNTIIYPQNVYFQDFLDFVILLHRQHAQ